MSESLKFDPLDQQGLCIQAPLCNYEKRLIESMTKLNVPDWYKRSNSVNELRKIMSAGSVLRYETMRTSNSSTKTTPMGSTKGSPTIHRKASLCSFTEPKIVPTPSDKTRINARAKLRPPKAYNYQCGAERVAQTSQWYKPQKLSLSDVGNSTKPPRFPRPSDNTLNLTCNGSKTTKQNMKPKPPFNSKTTAQATFSATPKPRQAQEKTNIAHFAPKSENVQEQRRCSLQLTVNDDDGKDEQARNSNGLLNIECLSNCAGACLPTHGSLRNENKQFSAPSSRHDADKVPTGENRPTAHDAHNRNIDCYTDRHDIDKLQNVNQHSARNVNDIREFHNINCRFEEIENFDEISLEDEFFVIPSFSTESQTNNVAEEQRSIGQISVSDGTDKTLTESLVDIDKVSNLTTDLKNDEFICNQNGASVMNATDSNYENDSLHIAVKSHDSSSDAEMFTAKSVSLDISCEKFPYSYNEEKEPSLNVDDVTYCVYSSNSTLNTVHENKSGQRNHSDESSKCNVSEKRKADKKLSCANYRVCVEFRTSNDDHMESSSYMIATENGIADSTLYDTPGEDDVVLIHDDINIFDSPFGSMHARDHTANDNSAESFEETTVMASGPYDNVCDTNIKLGDITGKFAKQTLYSLTVPQNTQFCAIHHLPSCRHYCGRLYNYSAVQNNATHNGYENIRADKSGAPPHNVDERHKLSTNSMKTERIYSHGNYRNNHYSRQSSLANENNSDFETIKDLVTQIDESFHASNPRDLKKRNSCLGTTSSFSKKHDYDSLEKLSRKETSTPINTYEPVNIEEFNSLVAQILQFPCSYSTTDDFDSTNTHRRYAL